jgi:hypothetical protein
MGRTDAEETKDDNQTYKRDLIEQAKHFIELYIESLTNTSDDQVFARRQ